MKKKLISLALVGSLLATFACKDDDNPVTPVQPGEEFTVLEGNLTTQSLVAGQKYLIRGQVFVQDGQTLTVPAGTVLFGEKRTKGTLIINEGGKLEAVGTAQNPIVFTSNQELGERDRGDWGGIVMVGRANVNQNRPAIEGINPEVRFGTFQSTANDTENSGTLQYVRIEFAGIELTPNNETNSLTMGALGSGTTIDHVQVSYGGDDGFEWFGGTVNAKNLISYSTWDDDYDVDFGFSGNVQFGLALRNPSYADQSGSNGFEVDNDAAGNDVQPYTSAVFSNMTIIGPRFNTGTSINANYQHAMHIRRRAAVSILNSIFTGFPIGLRLDGASTQANYLGAAPIGVLSNNTLIAVGSRNAAATPFAGTGTEDAAPVAEYWTAAGNEVVLNTPPAGSADPATKPDYAAANLQETWFFNQHPLGQYPANPDFTLGTAPQTAAFENAKVAGEFFERVGYRGAFGPADWTDGWSNFDPIDAEYVN